MRILIPIAFLLILGSCAPSRFVKPLDEGKQSVGASYGGALIEVPGVATMPIPFTTLSYGRALNKKTTAFGSWHTTAAIFGTFQTDIGIVREVYYNEKKQLGISVTPVANLAIDRWERNLKFWPQLDANMYWTYRDKSFIEPGPNGEVISILPPVNRNFLYVGLSNWFEMASTRAHEQPQPARWLLNPHVGHTFEREKWDFQCEFKFIAPNVSNQNIVVDYASAFGDRGALGFFFGVKRKFWG